MTLWWPPESQVIFDAENGVWGARYITAELNDPTSRRCYNPCLADKSQKVARLMWAQNLFGFQKKRRVNTTVRDKGRRVFSDLVNRDFNACAANRVLVGDITYLAIAAGTNMYLATAIDCFSRKLVGFAIADHMHTELVEKPSKTLPTCEEVLTVRFSTQITEASTLHRSSRQQACAWAFPSRWARWEPERTWRGTRRFELSINAVSKPESRRKSHALACRRVVWCS